MIKLNSVYKSFNGTEILKNLSSDFSEKTVYCVMGKSGIGKTTLLNIISGMLEPDSGSVSGTEKLKKSFVFQENRLIPHLSAYNNLKFVTDDGKKITEALKLSRLLDDKEKTPEEMSGGMKRRLAIARAAAFEGDIFFIDEPLYGLDIKTSQDILSMIKKMLIGKTAFIITHSTAEAYFLADKIIFLNSSPVSELIIKDISCFSSPEEIEEFI